MTDTCFDCDHELNSMNFTSGHNYYGGECHTKTVSGPCKCKQASWACSYPTCKGKAVYQYRDQYTHDEVPYLCEAHDELRRFIESCVRGALRKL